jgi:GNAT superfamily N-acetyltransferase
MSRFSVRRFEEEDTSACVALMRGNTPEFFTDAELSEFSVWLASRTSPYFVVQDADGRLAACGGYFLDAGGLSAGLTWGMVARGRHRQGIGSLLLHARLQSLIEDGVTEVRLDTSQLSSAFYERHGFIVISVQPDGYRPGLDRWDMQLRLTPSRPETSAASSAAPWSRTSDPNTGPRGDRRFFTGADEQNAHDSVRGQATI